jgi:hypothetical protein
MKIFLCDIENRILQCMVNDKNYNEIVKSYFTLVFDGCMIPNDIVEMLTWIRY